MTQIPLTDIVPDKQTPIARNPAADNIRFAKFLLLINALVPGALLLWDTLHDHAGPNPVNYAIHTTGMLSLVFLCLTLLVTPVRRITGLSWLFHFRRTLGLFAFFYALTHFSIFFVKDRELSISSTLHEMLVRKYLIIGSIGLFVMIPLAITSFSSMIKRLGAPRWRALHRLVYVAAACGAIHFYMQVKSDHLKPLIFITILSILLAYRLLVFLRARFENAMENPATSAAGFPVDTRWRGQLRIASIHHETPSVRTFRLASPDDSPLPFSHLPGQYLTLFVPINGKTVTRTYTIASAPAQNGCCELTIKREDQGLFSRHMHDQIKQGELLQIAAPGGKFTFDPQSANAIALLAGGVGITPLMSILRHLTASNWPGQVYLVYSNKTQSDIIFREELESLAKKHPNLHLILTLTREDSPTWTGLRGRIDAALLQQCIPDLTQIPIYLCGPADMLAATQSLLKSLHVPEQNIHTESFGTQPLPFDAAASAHTITFTRSNKSAPLNGHPSLLDLADSLSIPIPSECRSGICGTCKCRLISGLVHMQTTDALSAQDRSQNLILACQSRPLTDVTLDA